MLNVRTTLQWGIVTLVLVVLGAALYSNGHLRPLTPTFKNLTPCPLAKATLKKSSTGAYTEFCAVLCNDRMYAAHPADGPDKNDPNAYCCREGYTLLSVSGVETCVRGN